MQIPSLKYENKMKRLIKTCIWKEGKTRISLDTLSKYCKGGGFKLTDVCKFNDAVKLAWVMMGVSKTCLKTVYVRVLGP